MKKLSFLFLISAYSLCTFAGTIPVQSKIEAVTVYRQGAEVVNTASVDVPAGNSELVFEKLSYDVIANSLQVSGTSGITLLSAIYQLNYLEAQEKRMHVTIVQDSLDALLLESKRLAAKKSVLQQEEKMLEANKYIGGANTGVSTTELQKMADYQRSRLQQVTADLVDLEQVEKKLTVHIIKLRNQLEEFNQSLERPVGEVALNVSAKTATKVTLRISYLVQSSGWTPVYDLRADKLDAPVKLTYKANVYQNTGVNWEKVKLTLSTGNPTLSQMNPELSTWYVDFYQPKAEFASGKVAWEGLQNFDYEGDMAGEADSIKIKGARGEDAIYYAENDKLKGPSLTVSERQINVEFEIDVPYSIPSDGKNQLVSMDDYDLPASYTYFAIPKLDKDAFLVADITGWETANLLPGTANIFFEENYIGQTTLNPNETGDTLRVSFGRDNKVVVKREQLKDFTSKKFIATNKKVTSAYEISVRNTKQQQIKVEVQDQVPLSSNSSIVVETEETSGAVVDAEKGKLTWKYDLNPAETKSVRLIYSVKYPKGKTIAGL